MIIMVKKQEKKITAKMNIAEIIGKYPETAQVFFRKGIHCIGCQFASFESIGQGLLAHGMTESDVDDFINDLNNAVEKPEKKEKPKKKKSA